MIISKLSKVDVPIVAGPSEAGGGGWGGASTPNNLPKFADFVSEKGCKSEGRKERRFKFVYVRGSYQNLSKCNIF